MGLVRPACLVLVFCRGEDVLVALVNNLIARARGLLAKQGPSSASPSPAPPISTLPPSTSTSSTAPATGRKPHAGEPCKPGWSALRTGCTPKKPGKPKPTDTSKPPVQELTVDSLHAAIDEFKKDPSKVTENTPQELTSLLTKLTVKDLTDLKKRLGLKASGVKADLARKIARRALSLKDEKKTVNRAKPEGQRPTVDDMYARVQSLLAAGAKRDPETVQSLASDLGKSTVKDIHDLKRRLGLKASGIKSELARKVAERALALAEDKGSKASVEKPEESPEPTEQEPKPEHTTAPEEDLPEPEEPTVEPRNVSAQDAVAYLMGEKHTDDEGGVVSGVPIWKIAEATGMSGDELKQELFRLDREDVVRLVAAGDRSRWMPAHLRASIQGEDETFVIVEPGPNWKGNETATGEPEEPEEVTPQPPEPGFTGKDKHGHCWDDGEQVTCPDGEEPGADTATAEEEPGEVGGEEATEEPTGDTGGGGSASEGNEGDSRGLEEAPIRSALTTADRERERKDKLNRLRSAKRVSVAGDVAKNRIDRYIKFFRQKGDWQTGNAAVFLERMKGLIDNVGTDKMLAMLGDSVGNKNDNELVQYFTGTYRGEGGHLKDGPFVDAYLKRYGINVLSWEQQEEINPDIPAITPYPTNWLNRRDIDLAPYEGPHGFHAAGQGYKDKLAESKLLPGLASSESLTNIMGKVHNRLDLDAVSALDAKYGKGGWVVKPYKGRGASSGKGGVYFPQFVQATIEHAKAAIHDASENIANYGFTLARDPDTKKVVGLQHESGDTYAFGSDEYNNNIYGDAKHWGDVAAGAAENELGVQLEFSAVRNGVPWKATGDDYMAQPAFAAVGISEDQRAKGEIVAQGNEYRVHVMVRNGKAEVIPHATWNKAEWFPEVFENDETKLIQQTALDTINQLPETERQSNHLFSTDVMRTADGWKVIETNASGGTAVGGYTKQNALVMDAIASHVVGRDPGFVKFMTNLISKERKPPEKGFTGKSESGHCWVDGKMVMCPDDPRTLAPTKQKKPLPYKIDGIDDMEEADKESINKAMSKISDSVHDLLASKKVGVSIGHTVTAAAPWLKGRTPVGYPEGSTYDSVRGIFDWEDGVLVGLNYEVNGELVKNKGLRNTLRHEMGHALDKAMGPGEDEDWSDNKDFTEAWEQDRSKHTDTDDIEATGGGIGYFIQRETGAREVFAEMFGQLHGGGCQRDVWIEDEFPACAKLIRKALSDIEAGKTSVAGKQPEEGAGEGGPLNQLPKSLKYRVVKRRRTRIW